eukprot:s3618_g3.t1
MDTGKAQRLMLEDFLNNYFLTNAERIRHDKEHVVLQVPKEGPASAEMVETHWKLALEFFASSPDYVIPNLKIHQETLICLAKRYGIFAKQKGYGRIVKDWAKQEAPIIRSMLVHTLSLVNRSKSSRSPYIRTLKETLHMLLAQAGNCPETGIEAALEAAATQDEGDEVSTPSSCSASPLSVPTVPTHRHRCKAPQKSIDELETQLDMSMEQMMSEPVQDDTGRRQATKDWCATMHETKPLMILKPDMPDVPGDVVKLEEVAEKQHEGDEGNSVPDQEGEGPEADGKKKYKRKVYTTEELDTMWKERVEEFKTIGISIPEDYDHLDKKSFTLSPPVSPDHDLGSLGILWTLNQIYVNYVVNPGADTSVKVNKRDGATLSDLDMVELFSGEGELTRQCRSYGIDCRGFDILKNPLHDLASAEGFCIALTQTLRVKRNGVIWGGNPCSSWVWISDHSTKRRSSLGVMGDEEVPSVALTNCLAARFALLAMIAVIRGLFWCVEQPMSSLLPQCPYMAHVLTNMMPAFIQRTWLGAFQHWCCKPTQLFESWPSLEKLKATLSKQQRRALKDSSDGMYTKKTRPDGSTQVTGGKRLRSSGACPPEFGKKVAKLFLKGHDVPFSAAALAADRQKDLAAQEAIAQGERRKKLVQSVAGVGGAAPAPSALAKRDRREVLVTASTHVTPEDVKKHRDGHVTPRALSFADAVGTTPEGIPGGQSCDVSAKGSEESVAVAPDSRPAVAETHGNTAGNGEPEPVAATPLPDTTALGTPLTAPSPPAIPSPAPTAPEPTSTPGAQASAGNVTPVAKAPPVQPPAPVQPAAPQTEDSVKEERARYGRFARRSVSKKAPPEVTLKFRQAQAAAWLVGFEF